MVQACRRVAEFHHLFSAVSEAGRHITNQPKEVSLKFGWLVSFLSLFLHNNGAPVAPVAHSQPAGGGTIHNSGHSPFKADLGGPGTDGQTIP